jgi:hypothetical protein
MHAPPWKSGASVSTQRKRPGIEPVWQVTEKLKDACATVEERRFSAA